MTKTFAIESDAILIEQKDTFLLEARRPDWNEGDVLAAKGEINCALENIMTYDFNVLPDHYFYLLNDKEINSVIERLNYVQGKLTTEQTRRAK